MVSIATCKQGLNPLVIELSFTCKRHFKPENAI
jgi:hypothetical protein